jgi:EAL domain-containing protein (putative c-di-GMP-specific phosphodiesterase class I)
MVQAVVSAAAARHMTTIAEGVETTEQRDLLHSLGCTEMQDYLFSAAAVPSAQVRHLLTSRDKTAA